MPKILGRISFCFIILFGMTLSLTAVPSISSSSLSITQLAAFAQPTASIDSTANGKPPNFLVIVADDIGFSDIGPFGSEVPTPNLDALAKDGKILTDYHVMPTCSPTRSELLTGVDTHLNGLATMYESITPNQVGKSGYETYLNDRVITVADVLKDAGYHTIMSGKWHLSKIGEPVNGTYVSEPSTRGFEEVYTVLEGGSNHFTDAAFIPGYPVTFLKNGQKVDRYDGAYSTDLFTDEMINSIAKFQGDGKPLFMYLPLQVTHTPLQIPQQYIQKYMGKYDMGWDQIRNERFEKQKELGMWPADVNLPERFPPNPSWDSLSPDEQQYWSKTMSVFAGMVDNMDYNIGKLISYLKQIGEYDNTFIMFTSDNGGSEVPDLTKEEKFASGTVSQEASKDFFNNTYVNIGNPTSWIIYGETGATVAVSPLSGFKGTMYEGGIRPPLIIKQPMSAAVENTTGTSATNNQKIINAFVHVLDMTPTFLDYAGVMHPGSMYKGKEIYVPTTGKSIKPLLEGTEQKVHADDEIIPQELFGNSAVFMGDYKGLLMRPPAGDGKWALYDIKTDPGENNNLAANNTQILDKMILAYDNYARDVRVILPDPSTFPASLYGSLIDIYGQKTDAAESTTNVTQEDLETLVD